ncbi:MAG: acylphosphatase, partial [Armatimonadetes bacterium]|nr:acylphosphatase [Armatimonadota bacterium]
MAGRVHGVGYRAFVQMSASLGGLAGEVWNCRDGCVRGIVAGDSIDEFVKALWNGPGRIDAVTHEPAPQQEFPGFS